MIKPINRVKIFSFKTKIINIIMISGRKATAEKIFLSFIKKFQKCNSKHFKNLFQSAIINLTPTFKLNEQIVKKGKRKITKSNSFFIKINTFRVFVCLKLIKDIVMKNKKSNQFYAKLAEEFLLASNLKGDSVDKKARIQKQILANKRYLSKYYW